MDLHGQIMNLPANGATLDWANTREACLHGHRDARHAAAELAGQEDAEIEALRKDAERYRKLCASGKYCASDLGPGWGLSLCGGRAAKAELDAAVDAMP